MAEPVDRIVFRHLEVENMALKENVRRLNDTVLELESSLSLLRMKVRAGQRDDQQEENHSENKVTIVLNKDGTDRVSVHTKGDPTIVLNEDKENEEDDEDSELMDQDETVREAGEEERL